MRKVTTRPRPHAEGDRDSLRIITMPEWATQYVDGVPFASVLDAIRVHTPRNGSGACAHKYRVPARA